MVIVKPKAKHTNRKIVKQIKSAKSGTHGTNKKAAQSASKYKVKRTIVRYNPLKHRLVMDEKGHTHMEHDE